MSEKPLKVLKGSNGQLELYPEKIVITRKGLTAKMTQGFFKGDKTLFLRQITSIQVKKGGLFTNGYIQFFIGGANESTKGIMSATQDENTVMYNAGNNKLVQEIKQYIEKQNSAVHSPASISSPADEIKKWKELLDQGVITKKEFEAKKTKLMA